MNIMNNKKLLPILVDKQFEMKEIPLTMVSIPEDLKIQVGKKKDFWYNQYKFDNEGEYLEWRNWMQEQIKQAGYISPEKEANFVDLVFGMNYEMK